MTEKVKLADLETYVYIDVSNIRSACLKTLDLMIDFAKLLEYFRQKYPNLKDVRYYEGIAKGDVKKQRMFDFLRQKGYVICPLERKSYNSSEIEKCEVKCPKCKHKWAAEFTRTHRAMKSNVDVYLATELLTVAHQASWPTHIILVSCDGDYAEMISNALRNENVSISVLATPSVRDFRKNTLSTRLKTLRGKISNYYLTDIRDIQDVIKR
jgi:uncharacterized LabA/DUF88 family protein